MPSPRPRTLAAAAFVLSSTYALAHAHPTSMTPAADASVSSPATVSVTFSEALEPKFSTLKVLGEDGKQRNTAAAAAVAKDPRTLTLALPALPPGTYTVRWVSVATDGHRLEGSYKFSVK